MAGLLFQPLGLVLAFPTWLLLAWLTRGAHLLASLPYAAVSLPPLPLWLLVGYYLAIAGLLLARARRQARLHSQRA